MYTMRMARSESSSSTRVRVFVLSEVTECYRVWIGARVGPLVAQSHRIAYCYNFLLPHHVRRQPSTSISRPNVC